MNSSEGGSNHPSNCKKKIKKKKRDRFKNKKFGVKTDGARSHCYSITMEPLGHRSIREWAVTGSLRRGPPLPAWRLHHKKKCLRNSQGSTKTHGNLFRN